MNDEITVDEPRFGGGASQRTSGGGSGNVFVAPRFRTGFRGLGDTLSEVDVTGFGAMLSHET